MNTIEFITLLISNVSKELFNSPFSTILAGTVLELGVYSLPEFFSEPSTSVPVVSTSSSFNKLVKSDEDTLTKVALVTGHSMKIGLILVIGLSILTATINLIQGPGN